MKFAIVILAACSLSAKAYNVPNKPEISRRSMLGTAAGAAALLLGNREALADDDVITPLYFGVGVSSNFGVWKGLNEWFCDFVIADVFVWIFH